MRNRLRVLVFDVVAPLATIAGLLVIGVVLDWPRWWVAVCSMLCLLVAQVVVVNALGFRRDSVTMGTDDDEPRLRTAAAGITAATVVAAAAVGYTQWTLPDRAFNRDNTDVVRLATTVAEATATFTPADPTSSIDRAAALMVPETAAAFKAQFASSAADLAKRNVTATARTLSAGLEALGVSAASVAVVVRATQAEPGRQPSIAVLPIRIAATKQGDSWKVVDVSPISSR
ncbi:MAG: hypothetical protein WCH82_09765 [Mycobacteriaceae bacterium]